MWERFKRPKDKKSKDADELKADEVKEAAKDFDELKADELKAKQATIVRRETWTVFFCETCGEEPEIEDPQHKAWLNTMFKMTDVFNAVYYEEVEEVEKVV